MVLTRIKIPSQKTFSNTDYIVIRGYKIQYLFPNKIHLNCQRFSPTRSTCYNGKIILVTVHSRYIKKKLELCKSQCNFNVYLARYIIGMITKSCKKIHKYGYCIS